MKNNFPLIALGAFVLLTVFNKKSDSKSSSIKSDPSKEDQPKVDPKTDSNQGNIKFVWGNTPQIKTCSANEYYDPVSKQCLPFWEDGTTDAEVEKKFNELVAKIQPQNSDICFEVLVGENYTSNPKAINIIKQTISELWKISLDRLPPKDSDPDWLKVIWKRVYELYYAKICNMASGWN